MTGWTNGDRITRIPPGSDRLPFSAVPKQNASVRVLCVANLTPGKGHAILLRALAAVPHVDWTLTCAGSERRDPDTAWRVRALARELGIASRIEWRGELDDAALDTAYAEADLFALATRSETYGMAVAEAIAHRVPVISTRTGEIPSIVGGAGLLAEPGDTESFGSVMTAALSKAALRRALRDRARDAAQRLPTWEAAAAAMSDVLTRVAQDE
jgi:glycosyltransferase involved in cell wall biosynthesis